MKSRCSVIVLLVGLSCVGLTMLGCADSSSEASGTAEASRFLLTEEPGDAQGVTACRTVLEENEGPREVTLTGRVGGLSQPTWDPERAAFMMSDLSWEDAGDEKEEAVSPQHDADNCPFCRARKRKELAALAMVELVDDAGETPALDAQTIPGLSEGAVIVLRGTAELDSLGTLRVRTGGVYVKSAE